MGGFFVFVFLIKGVFELYFIFFFFFLMHLFNPVCVNLVAGHILLSCCLFTALAAQPAISSPVCVCVCVCIGSRGRYKALSVYIKSFSQNGTGFNCVWRVRLFCCVLTSPSAGRWCLERERPPGPTSAHLPGFVNRCSLKVYLYSRII